MKNSVVLNAYVMVAGCHFEIAIDRSYFYPKPTSASLHSHADFEVHLVKQGRYVLGFHDNYMSLSQGSLCVIPPNTYHSNVSAIEDCSEKYCFRFNIGSCDNPQNEIQKKIRYIDSPVLFHDCKREENLAREIFREHQAHLFDSDRCIHHLLYLFILYLIRRLTGLTPDATAADQLSLSENRTTVIDAFFAFHYMDNIHADDLARTMNLSTRQLNRVLQKHYGMTFKQKLIDMRLAAAKDQLRDSEKSIQDISLSVGYKDIEYFCSIFTASTGLTPAKYRKERIINTGNS